MDFEKSMKYTNKKRTICEVVRECNDLLTQQRFDNTDYIDMIDGLHNKIEEIHSMAKSMSKRLYKYSKEWDKDFWLENKDYEADLKRRLNE